MRMTSAFTLKTWGYPHIPQVLVDNVWKRCGLSRRYCARVSLYAGQEHFSHNYSN
ncbi:hypothetical protein HMPREF9997_02301 [Corynebacterium durum F0235]|uniref:Uncharacterized protein n=1 Tax=Corynebacterium durum F0235 TaxID=1035195 RepID=L1MBM5_9CORY|nr:hypothetical protein HMPREF9997_02301 [Corynebacterium durum F0235]